MVDSQDRLFREVDEELRREQLKKLWDNYGTYILGAAAAIVLGVGGVKWYQASAQSSAELAGARFERAFEQISTGKTDDARKAMQEIAKGDAPGYAALAQLALAGDAVKAGNTDAAVAAYEAVASRSTLDPVLRDYARLQIASLKLDTVDFTELQNRLKDLMVDTSPWRFAARELIGVAALHAGRLEDARRALEPLVIDANAPQGARERSGALMQMVVEAELARSAPPMPDVKPAPAPAAPAAAPKSEAPPPGGPKKK